MSKWMPSLNALRAFEAVSRHLSYSEAAKELGVTPGAVKHLVSKLEDALNAELIRRTGNGLELTPIGKTGRSDLARGMRHLSESVLKMRRYQTRKRLTISVEASLAATWLAPRLNEFLTMNPEIDVFIDASQKVFDLKRSDVDIAIRYGVGREEDLIADRLFEDLVIPACSPSIISEKLKLGTMEQLAKVPLIHWDTLHLHSAKAARHWFSWEAWARAAGVNGIDTSKGKRFSDYGLAVQAAVSGQGVLLGGWPGLMDTFQKGLLVCPFPEGVMKTDIGFDLVTTRDARQRPEVVTFCDWVLETASKVPSFR